MIIEKIEYLIERFLIKTSSLWPDRLYISAMYRLKFGKKLDWKHPATFTEKLNWEKVYNRKAYYTSLADKYAAKQIVAELIGSEYVVPCYGVWDNFDDVDFSELPDKYVLKTTHDSSGVCICKDKHTFDFKVAKQKIESSIKRNWYYSYREWVYKDIKPQVIADKFLDDKSGKELVDYKFWCFDGVPKLMYFTNKGSSIFENFYDMDFNPVNISRGYSRVQPEFPKPECFEKMKELAAKISFGIPFVRVDFFYVESKIYFGECTFYDWAGFMPFLDAKDDILLGSWITLPEN